MFILNKDKNLLINGEKIISIKRNDKKIIAITQKEDYCVGEYDNIEEANKIFEDLKTYILFSGSYFSM